MANAFGWSVSSRYTAGIGSPALRASCSTMPTSSGAEAWVTGRAWCMRSTVLSEFQYAQPFMASAMKKAISAPLSPAIR